MTANRQISEFASFVAYDTSASNIAITTTSGSPNVGIGSTIPEQKLTISGSGYISGSLGIGFSNPSYTLSVTNTGTSALAGLTNCLIDATANANSYSQINVRNANNQSNASADLIITADNGSDSSNYVDLGINNSGYSVGSWTINGANDAYLYASDGNFSIGVAGSKYLSFFTGGTLASNERLRITSTGNIGIGTTNPTVPLNVVGTGITGNTALLVSNGSLGFDGYDNGTWVSEKTFNVSFPVGTANQKVQIYWPTGSRLQGGYEVTIASGYNYAQASGMIRKIFGVHLAENGGFYVQRTTVPFSLGSISSWFTISDIQWDSTNSRWYFIVANLAGTGQSGNNVTISIKSFINPVAGSSVWLNARASATSISSIYSTDTTVYPQLTAPTTDNYGNFLVGAATSTGTASQPLQVNGGAYVSGNLGIGTTNPTSTLTIQGDLKVSGNFINSTIIAYGIAMGM